MSWISEVAPTELAAEELPVASKLATELGFAMSEIDRMFQKGVFFEHHELRIRGHNYVEAVIDEWGAVARCGCFTGICRDMSVALEELANAVLHNDAGEVGSAFGHIAAVADTVTDEIAALT